MPLMESYIMQTQIDSEWKDSYWKSEQSFFGDFKGER